MTALYDKIDNLAVVNKTSPTIGLSDVQTDAIDALVALGYDLSSARETVKNIDGESANELGSKALKQVTDAITINISTHGICRGFSNLAL